MLTMPWTVRVLSDLKVQAPSPPVPWQDIVLGGSSWKKVSKMLAGEGGMFAYLGHKDAQLLEKMAREGDQKLN